MHTPPKIGSSFLFAVVSLLFVSPALANVSGVSVTPSPATVNTNAQYTLNFTTGSGGALTLSSTITAVFPANTVLPASFPGGAGGQVTVNGTTATASGSGQTLTIAVPRSDIGNDTAVTVVITSGISNIVNPSLPGTTYRVSLSTSEEATGVNSSDYTIAASGTALIVGAVTVAPATIGNTATCSISATLGGDGALWGGNSQIVVTFQNNTGIRTGAITGAQVNGTGVTSATGNPGARTITLVPQQTIPNGTPVTIFLPATAYRNPTSAGNYTLTVSTSAQPSAGTSSVFNVTTSVTAVAVGSVTPNPNTIGNLAQYTINFNTAADGALVGGVSTITLGFPSDTQIANGAIANVTVAGVTAVSATGNAGARSITVIPAQDIHGGLNNRAIVIPNAGAIRNPSSSSNYTLQVSTSVQTTAGTSPAYAIGQSATLVNVDSVNVSPAVIGNPAQYTVQFDVSSDGALTGGVSTITVAFPAGTAVTNGALAGITVNGTGADSATGNSGSRTLTLVPNQSLAGGTNNVVVVVPASAVRNPTTAGNRTLTVATSLQPAGTSPQYSLGQSATSVAFGSVVANPNTIANPAQYMINFNTSTDGALVGGVSHILVTFPSNTAVTDGALSGVTVEGVAVTSASGSSASRIVDIMPANNIAGSTANVTVVIPSSGVRNPTTSANYTLQVATSPQPAGTSPAYAIGQSATLVNVDSVNVSPAVIGNPAQYTVQFDVSSDGALTGGVSTITLAFPAGTAVTNGALAGVTVNGTGADSATGNSGSRTLTLVPNQSLAGGTNNVVVVVPASAVRNPTTAGNRTLTVATSLQPAGTSPQYTIGLSSTPLTVGAVTPNPTVVGNPASYSLTFNTASNGYLVGGTSEIVITFPNGTAVTNGALTGVTVGGLAASSATGSSASRIITIVPQQNISGSTNNVAVFIPATGVRNPTTAGSYNLTVSTSPQPAGTSSQYTLGQSTTAIAFGSVVASPNTIGNPAQYTINFNTAADGPLVGGASHIIITFPNGTVVTNGAITGVTVEGVAASSAVGSSASRTVDIVLANNVAGGFANVTVIIPATGVRNPVTLANYTLQVATTPQPAGTSPAYAIGKSATPLVVNSVTPNPSTIGNASQYTVNLNIASDGALIGGTSQIVITFPNDTAVTNGALAGVTVGGLAATSATGVSASRMITIVPQQSIPGNTASVIVLIPSSALRNPTAINTYTLTVGSSVQPDGISPGYAIGQSSTQVNVTATVVNPATVGNPAQYTMSFVTSPDGALLAASSTVIVVFPSNTAISNGPIAGATVNGLGASATGSSASRTITLTVPSAIAGSTAATVVIPATAVTNPTTSGNYSLTLATSVQPAGNSPLYAIGLSGSSVNVTGVTPTPPVVGNGAAYTVTFVSSADGAITAGTGTILITFPNDTVVPNGALANLTINGAAPQSATGTAASRRITLVPNANLPGGSTISVVVPLSVGLRNPTATGNYTLSVASSAQPAGTSPGYAITQSTTPVNVASVTPAPTTVGSNASYTIQFTTSADGPLFSGISHIRVSFPSDTGVTTGAIVGITVNGTPASATGNGATREIDIIIGANIGVSTAVTLVIPQSALQNPTLAGNYTLSVATTAQPAGVSPPYAISFSSVPVNVTAVLPTSSVVNTLAGYTVNFTPAVVLRANASTIFLIFPPSTVVPNGPVTGVTVGGIPPASATGDPATRLISIRPSADVLPSVTTAVAIPTLVIQNASIPGAMPMNVSTTAQPLGTRSFTLVPSSTTISLPTALPAPSQAGQIAAYTISFSVGTYGRLTPGNTIFVQFPTGTTFPSTIPVGSVTVNGISNTQAYSVVGDYVHVVVPPGVGIANQGAVTLVFTSSALIRNTGQGAVNLADVHTDAEPTPRPSNFFIITADSQLSPAAVIPDPDALYANAQYTVVFSLGSSGSLEAGQDSIQVLFNSATGLPQTIGNPGFISVNGTPVSAVSRFSTGFNMISPISIAAGALDKTVTIVFQAGLGIVNPSLPGNYTVTVHTSIEDTPIVSNPYAIRPSASTQITQPQFVLSPAFINSLARAELTFNLGSLGGLTADASTITLVFPDEFVLPSVISPEAIRVNDQPLATEPMMAGQALTLTVPVAVARHGAVVVTLLSATRIQNPGNAGNYALTLFTSSEPTPVVSTAVQIRPSTWDDVTGYPNPLKYDGSAKKAITFLFVPDQTATLRLYTLDGKLVKTLIKNDTTDRMVWNLDNERGRIVASGIYLYVIQGSTGEKRGKIGFLK